MASSKFDGGECRRARFLGPLLVLVGTLAAILGPVPTLAQGPSSMQPGPRIYVVKGFLDDAPTDDPIVDRIEIRGPEGARRELLITSYGSRIPLGHYLSANFPARFVITGAPEEVGRLFASKPATFVDAMLLASPDGAPMLRILELGLGGEPRRGL